MSKIFNKKFYATGIVCCVAAAAIYAGVSYQKPDIAKVPPENQQASEEIQNRPVVANKNAPNIYDRANDLNAVNDVGGDDAVAKADAVIEPENETAKAEEQKPEENETEEQEAAAYEYEAVETIQDDSTGFTWPVTGDIVMDYSVDTAIYDVTLDQYRTNDFISIGAEVGETVKAAGSGTVEFVGVDAERGNTVVINHNDGWKTTYCQLQDGVLVEEGQSVSKGDAIGKVGEATIYSTMLGSHLDFKVTNNDELVDPKVALAD